MYIIAQAPSAAGLTIASGASTVAFNVIAGEPGAGTQCNLNVPGSNKLNGQPFRVRAAGNIVLAAGTYTSSATPISVILFASNTASFTAALANNVFSSTAVAIFTQSSAVATSLEWSVEGYFQGDNTGAKLMGQAFAETMTPSGVQALTSPAAAPNVLGSVNFAAEPPAQFAVGFLTAAANLLNVGTAVANLTQFVLEG
jgi:hypothetical protein